MTSISTQNLTITVADQQIVEKLNIDFLPGEIWGVLGPNGAGKTTLLHTLAGLRETDDGKILLDKMDIRNFSAKKRAQKIGLLAQDTDFSFPSTVFESALIGRYPHSKNWFGELNSDIELTNQALVTMQMEKFLHRSANTLSGGEKRRLAFAAVLTQDPDIFLLDEPTNHLDLAQKIRTLTLLKQLAKEKRKVVIMVLHDITLLRNFCDNVIVMGLSGQCNYGDCSQMLSAENLNQIFPTEILEFLC